MQTASPKCVGLHGKTLNGAKRQPKSFFRHCIQSDSNSASATFHLSRYISCRLAERSWWCQGLGPGALGGLVVEDSVILDRRGGHFILDSSSTIRHSNFCPGQHNLGAATDTDFAIEALESTTHSKYFTQMNRSFGILPSLH